jgi:lipopolysaccharide transport system ATP-binding protein
MSDVAIKVEGLGKKYLLHHQAGGRHRYVALRDVLADKFKRLIPRNPQSAIRNPKLEEFWALKEVSFEIKQGEAVGIIGRNGAGKSTLLKLLSRITEPTKGRIEIDGRVASLLEVGTGFHPELTGRENIFLNGAILGMHRAEIKKKFDEIVAFAEVEKFLDTPVKHFSSGMYMRLAFAVAAHLEPKILIVDEVLAVGDAAFQKKCLGKMGEVAQGGRTILFVSHNMEAVLRLCQRGILLHQGGIAYIGDVKSAIAHYTGGISNQPEEIDLTKRPRKGILRQRIQFVKVRLGSAPDRKAWHIPFGTHLAFEIEVRSNGVMPFAEIGVSVFTTAGLEIISTLSSNAMEDNSFGLGDHKLFVDLGALYLLPGSYRISLGSRSDFGMEDYLFDAIEFEIDNSELSAKFRTDTFAGLMSPPIIYRRHELNFKSPQPASGNDK